MMVGESPSGKESNPSSTQSTRFEEIDWETEPRTGIRSIPRRYLAMVLTLLVVFGAFLYDYYLIPENEPTVKPLSWQVTQVDWLFIVTLIVLFYTVLIPLYTNPRMTRYYWREFRKNRAAVVSLIFLICVFVIGLIGPLILDQPTIHLQRKFQPPLFFSIDNTLPLQCAGEVANGRCYGSTQYPLGTTSQGKNILNIIVYGMQVSMKIGLITALIVITIASAVGSAAAHYGSLVDELLMRYVDLQQVFPSFLLYLFVLYLFGASLFMFIVVFGLLGWGGIARLVRSEALQRREEEYISAAQSAGGGSGYIIWRHILPNVSSTVITAVTILIPAFILYEASLAFIGLGDPTIPSWGQAIAQGRNGLPDIWWSTTVPGFFLFLTILAFNFMGDALRDALDPRMEGGS